MKLPLWLVPKFHGDGSLGCDFLTQEIESNMEGLPSKTDSELTEASDMWSGYVWFMIFVWDMWVDHHVLGEDGWRWVDLEQSRSLVASRSNRLILKYSHHPKFHWYIGYHRMLSCNTAIPSSPWGDPSRSLQLRGEKLRPWWVSRAAPDPRTAPGSCRPWSPWRPDRWRGWGVAGMDLKEKNPEKTWEKPKRIAGESWTSWKLQ